MKLRTRLLLGYGYLVLLVILVAGVSTVGIFELSKGIRSVLVENFASVSAAIDMQQALERQDSILLQALVRHSAAEQFDVEEKAFQAALNAANQNITIEGEQEIVDSIRFSYAKMVERRAALLRRESPGLVAYDTEVHPSFEETKASVLRLMELNYEAMVSADESALEQASRFGLWIGILVTLALGSVIVIARGLQHYVVRRLDELSHISRAVSAGETHRRFVERHEDELGEVAGLLNGTLDQLDEYRNRAISVEASERKLAAALFASLVAPPAILLDAGGNAVARVGEVDEVDGLLADGSDAVERPLRIGERTIGRILTRS